MSALAVLDDDALSDLLMAMNEAGTEPVAVGFDRHGSPFLAYGWAPGGDGWDTGFVNDDPRSSELDYSDGTGRCQECGAFDRRPTERLAFPVTVVIRPTDTPAPAASSPASQAVAGAVADTSSAAAPVARNVFLTNDGAREFGTAAGGAS